MAEDEIRWLSSLVASSHDAIIGATLDGRIDRWNPGAGRLLGYNAERAIGSPIAMLWPPDGVDEGRRWLDRIHDGRDVPPIQARWRRQDGREIDVHLSLSPIRGADGQVLGSALIARESADRGRAGTSPDANERRFRETFETAAVGIAHVCLDGPWLLVNRKFCEIVGYSREELLGMTFQELTHPADLEADLANARALLAGEVASFTMEKRYIHKDGSIVWVNLTVSLSREEQGRPPYFIGFIEDIGARKRAEEALHAARERLSMAQRGARSGVWDWSLADGSVFWTPEFCELYGFDVGVPPSYEAWLAAVHPDDRARADEEAREFFDQRRDCDQEFRIIHPTLGVRSLAGVGSLTFDAEGRPVRWVGINIDITERKRAEMEVRRRELEFQALAENSPDIIARFDLQRRHLYVNGSIEGVTGIRRHEFLGRTNRELGMPEDLCLTWDRMLEASIETRRQVGFEFEFEGKAGRRHFHSRFVPEFGPDGGVASILGVATDVTDRKVLQAELLTIAEREQRRIGQDLHDDVGQELTGVGLMADALAEALQEGGSPEAALAAKIRARLGHIQGRVRALSRGLIPVEVDAGGLMDALDELAGRCRELHGLDCTFECAEPVPVEDNRVATHLYRITQEAIANATKSGHARHVRVSLRREGGITTLEVRDDGDGILEESRRGDGMGLRIMQYRAGLIGGILEVGPDQGRGTRVTCSIGGDHGDDRARGSGGPGGGPDPDRRRPPDRPRGPGDPDRPAY